MSKKKMFLILLLSVFIFSTRVEAEAIINPEWIRYMELSPEEQEKYDLIPDEYVIPFVSKKKDYTKLKDLNVYTIEEELPSKFNLANLDNKNYVNTVKKHQESLGLCWAFAAIGSTESNMMYHGVLGLDEAIDKCNSGNDKYCQYKIDKEINDKYINGEVVNNATFSERNLDYVIVKPTGATFDGVGEKYDLIKEKYNPYTFNKTIGSAGTFELVSKLFSYGVTPKRALNEWQEYNSKATTMSLEQVYDSVSTDYVVSDTYDYFPNSSLQGDDAKEWRDGLKRLIVEYGAVHVGTIGPTTTYGRACYYYNEEDKMGLINNDGNCGGNGYPEGHAMQIIGWDDDYTFGYCKVDGVGKGGYTEESCEAEGYEWASGTGVWILKNSWGAYLTYLYLSYNSRLLNIHGVKNIRVKDFDNSYNEKISAIQEIDNTSEDTRIFKYYKSNDIEYLSRVSVIFRDHGKDTKIYISNDGVNYDLIGEDPIELSGMYSFTKDNYVLDGNTFYVKIVGVVNLSAGMPTVLTKNECSLEDNCNSDPEIETYKNFNGYIDIDKKEIEFRTKSRNIKSGEKLDYKIYDGEGNDVSDKFVIDNNYVVDNNNILKVNFNSDIEEGKYVLKTIYNDLEDETVFYLINGDAITINVRDDIYVADKTLKIDYDIKIDDEVSNYRYSVSDENVATIDNGILNIKKSGKITITLTVETSYGDVSTDKEIIIYDDKISTPEEFITIFSLKNQEKNYYIVNDLDFSSVDYDSIVRGYREYGGIINGGYHTIKNIKTNAAASSSGVALIPRLRGIIMNMIITDSSFVNTSGDAGVVTAFLYNEGMIKNVYVSDTVIVNATKNAGGIAAYINNINSIDNCVFAGIVKAEATSNNVSAGGIVGAGYFGYINNSYNKGQVIAKLNNDSSNKYKAIATGIYNGSSGSRILNSYNIGDVIATSTSSEDEVLSGGLTTSSRQVIVNSYYLDSDNYTYKDDYGRSRDELLNKDNYQDWDFKNIWYMKDDYPILRVFPVDITDIRLDIFTKIFNTNSEYKYNYIIEPYGDEDKVKIENMTPEIIDIRDGMIITKDKIGIGKIKLVLDDSEFIYEYEVRDILKIDYDKEYTNKNLIVSFDLNYYRNSLSDGYLEFIYRYQGEEYSKKITTMEEKIELEITHNCTLEYEINYIGNVIEKVQQGEIEITNIDKDRPLIVYNYDRDTKMLKIDIKDNTLGLDEDNEYRYGIGINEVDIPLEMNNYKNQEEFKIDNINYKYKYLWIKNVSDKVGNKLCDYEYCVYDLGIERNNYQVNYYDDDKITLIKREEYLEDEILSELYNYNKEDKIYHYVIDKWDGYIKDMVINSDINLYAIYKKEAKYIESSIYSIDDNYIKNIMIDNIYNKYMYNDFKKNLQHDDGFILYDKNTLVDNPVYIKTGMEYKNNYKTYKIILGGDVNGDGIIKMNDVMMIANHLIDNNTLKDEYYQAGDLTGDGKVKMNDLMKLAIAMANGGEL